MKKFMPPMLEEVKEYQKQNPELLNVDPIAFWKGYNDGGWVDTQGKPVKNWKLKLRTWSKNADKWTQKQEKIKLFPIAGKTCCKTGCRLPAVYKAGGGEYDSFYCGEHMPPSVKERYTF